MNAQLADKRPELFLPSTPRTPEVLLDSSKCLLSIKGESYPENVLSFYAPVMESIREVLMDARLTQFQMDIHITYYNSSSAKALYRVFQLLNHAGEQDIAIHVRWHFDEEDDMARDQGINFREDFPAIDFVEVPLAMA